MKASMDCRARLSQKVESQRCNLVARLACTHDWLAAPAPPSKPGVLAHTPVIPAPGSEGKRICV